MNRVGQHAVTAFQDGFLDKGGFSTRHRALPPQTFHGL
jgi:hypothetical protein